MKRPLTTILQSLIVLTLNSAYAETTNPAAIKDITPSQNQHASAAEPEEFNIEPSQEVLNQIRKAMGDLSPEESGQVDSALKKYRQVEQYQKPVEAIADTYPVKLHERVHLEVNVVSGFESELVFFDLQGKPWEIGNVSVGNKELVTATKSTLLTHSATISASDGALAGRTNLKVQFEGLDASVSFPIVVNTESYHESLKVVLPGKAPQRDHQSESVQLGTIRQALDDPIARAILDNPHAPETSTECQGRDVSIRDLTGAELFGINAVAFACGDLIYVRSRYLSSAAPEPNGIIYGPDGFRVYRFKNAGEIMSFTAKDGRMIFLELPSPSSQIGARFGDSVRIENER